MFKEIFLFDLRHNFRKPQTYIFFGIYFLISLMLGLTVAGVLELATGDTNVYVNSANSISGILIGLNDSILGLVNSVILVAIMATAIQKDYEYNTHPLFFTKPINKTNYFFGRFFSAFFTALFVFSAQILGYYLGTLFGIGQPQIGPFVASNFIQPFLIFTIPNVLLLGIILFAITTYTRNTLNAYLFCILLLVIRTVLSSMTSDLDNKEMAAILEPFGAEALSYTTQYWTPFDQNTRSVPLEGVLLQNRLLWFGIALIITFVTYFKFSFSQFLSPFSWFKRKNESATNEPAPVQSLSQLPKVSQHFSFGNSFKQMLYLAKFEFAKLTKSTFFIIICALGVVMMFTMAQYMGAMYETETYPLTYQILESVASIFQFFILILLVFFSGTIIWRDRERKMDELIGTTPVSNTALFFSKYLALSGVIAVMLLLISVTGMLIQAAKGYYNFEPFLYLKASGRMLVGFIITAGICLAFQVFSPNKYLGFFLSLMPILFVNILFSQLEWNNQIYIFNSSGPSMSYSDMNGYGHTVGTWFLYKGYWLSVVLVICLLALLFFARGKEKGLKPRFRLSGQEFKGKHKLALTVLLLCAFSAGGYIFYNTNIIHKNTNPKQQEEEQVAYEKKYKKYQKLLQPRIVASNVNVDIEPQKRWITVHGFYYLKNKQNQPIDSLFVNYLGGQDVDYKYHQLEPEVPHKEIFNDSRFGSMLIQLEKPLQPGDSIKFNFSVEYRPIGFKNGSAETQIVQNGTFFNSMIFPSIGYSDNGELSSNAARKKYGLPEKPRMASVTDSVGRLNNYISNDADWLSFEATVSTDKDQIAIAPGYLQKEWVKDGKRYFHYKMDTPILNFYAFLSARYEVKRDKWNDVNIEIYYQKGHEYNVDRMINSIKKSLTYYTESFGPYQHKQVRIIEFPRYESFAQAFPNTIPFSESIGFIAKVDDKDNKKIDVPFYVTAHEVAHQWWAHQVIGGNVQGSVLMSETMSQYSALMVMEKEYGKQAMKKFLKYEMDGYLKGRTTEAKKEVPLMLCENQGYIHYKKGSVVMYALRDYLGEDVLNAAIRSYLNKVKFQEPPYTNAIEFVDVLKAATPDSLQYLIKDMFETITIYENYVADLKYEAMSNGKYKVKIMVGSAKYRADSLGNSKAIPVADYIDVGIYGAKNKKGVEQELMLTKVKMDKAEKTFEFEVTEKPERAGIDPYLKLIDRNADNNMWKFGSKPPKPNLDVKEAGNLTIQL